MSDLQQSSNHWIVIYITHNLPEAHIVAGRLEHEGIPAIVDYMAGRSALGLTIGTWGEVRVLVHPDDYEIAHLILFPDEPDQLPNNTNDINYIWNDDDE